ncbi:uncharacterized protein G6M90_00g055250 [Metarhizium brunneum]|uniref:Uncharacterized protein n=1 Tax=Metarhizium brunneum TaxID=500148 RepID=A0A7D5Z7T1_9HYPO|nr:hypothetical protein G6M90_00g055250 [Metarhizium brunneum]
MTTLYLSLVHAVARLQSQELKDIRRHIKALSRLPEPFLTRLPCQKGTFCQQSCTFVAHVEKFLMLPVHVAQKATGTDDERAAGALAEVGSHSHQYIKLHLQLDNPSTRSQPAPSVHTQR